MRESDRSRAPWARRVPKLWLWAGGSGPGASVISVFAHLLGPIPNSLLWPTFLYVWHEVVEGYRQKDVRSLCGALTPCTTCSHGRRVDIHIGRAAHAALDGPEGIPRVVLALDSAQPRHLLNCQ